MSRRLQVRFGVILFVTLLSLTLLATRGINLGLDLRGGLYLVLRVVPESTAENLSPMQAVEQAERVIQNRLDGLGIGEITTQRYGSSGDQLLVQIPGDRDATRLKQIIQSMAVLQFRLVDDGPFTDPPASGRQSLRDAAGLHYVLRKDAPVSGQDLKDAFHSRDENGNHAVGFSLTSDGARRFGQLTEQNIGKYLAVVLDDRIQSVARIESRITDSGIIRGGGQGFASKEVDDLVVVLRSGAMPASIEYEEEHVLGPSLGSDSIRQGITAAVVALVSVASFILFYYRWAGANAVISMLLNIVLLLGSMAYFRSPLTLPGIAGIILTIGVGIDSNVLIFERVREEIRAGRAPVTAIATGFNRVFITLIDTHLAALISAAFLFAFGTGAIRGFAVTLAIGLACNMFTSVFVSRTLFDWSLARQGRTETISI